MGYFIKTDVDFLKSIKWEGSALHVYMIIRSFSGADYREAFPSNVLLQEQTGLAKNTVSKALQWLTENGVLTKTDKSYQFTNELSFINNPQGSNIAPNEGQILRQKDQLLRQKGQMLTNENSRVAPKGSNVALREGQMLTQERSNIAPKRSTIGVSSNEELEDQETISNQLQDQRTKIRGWFEEGLFKRDRDFLNCFSDEELRQIKVLCPELPYIKHAVPYARANGKISKNFFVSLLKRFAAGERIQDIDDEIRDEKVYWKQRRQLEYDQVDDETYWKRLEERDVKKSDTQRQAIAEFWLKHSKAMKREIESIQNQVENLGGDLTERITQTLIQSMFYDRYHDRLEKSA